MYCNSPLFINVDEHLWIGGFLLLIKDLLKEFTFDLQIKNYSKRTIETYNYNVSQFIYYQNENHEITEIEDISTIHIKKFIQYQLDMAIKLLM